MWTARSAVTVCAVAPWLASCSTAPAEQHDPVPVAVEAASLGNQADTVTGLGQVQGFYTADARAQTSGQILRVAFEEGRAVRAGQPLAQIDPRPLQATLAADRSQLDRDLAALGGAKDTLARNAPLVSSGLATEQQLAGYRVQVAQLTAAVAGTRALLDRDRLSLGYATIRAPISGVAGVRKVDPGNVVGPGDLGGIVTIVQVQPIALTFSIPQASLGAIQSAVVTAGAAGLSVDALQPGGENVIETGHLTVVNNQIDKGNGTVTLKAIFPNARRTLWPGQLVSGRLRLGGRRDAVTIPLAAVQRNPQGSFVWVVENGRARMKVVKLGSSSGDRVIVTNGVAGGETVVTDGQFALTPGVAVMIAHAGDKSAPLRSDDPHRLGLQP